MKGHEIQMMVRVQNSDKAESELKKEFERYFIKRTDYGFEYFEGNVKKMIRIIINNVIDEENMDDEEVNDTGEDNIYKEYLDERTEKSDKNIHTKTLYEDFCKWYNEKYDNEVPTNRRFVKEIRVYVSVENKVKVTNSYSTTGIKRLKIKN